MKKLVIVVALFFVFAGLSFAQSDIGFYGFGGRVGFVMPEDPIDNTIALGLNGDLGTIMPNLALFVYIDYWSKSYDQFNTEVSFTTLGFGAIVKYMFEVSGDIKPYAGGGLGLQRSSSSVEYKGDDAFGGFFGESYETDASETDLGIHFLGGASMALSPAMDGFAEVKYTIDGIDHLGIYVGINYKLR
jgi:opacity protein-like surface antigen